MKRPNESNNLPDGPLDGPLENLPRLLRSGGRFAWSMTLLGARGMANLLRLRPPASSAELDELSQRAAEQLDGPFERAAELAEKVQDSIVDGVFDAFSPATERQRPGRGLDASTFVVLGDGFSAGMGHFALEGSFQATSLPALLAQAIGTELRQPLLQPPGLGDVIGLPPQPAIVPGIRQSTVLEELPRSSDLGNLSVPGFSFADALDLRPRAPLIDRACSRTTLANFILGLPDLQLGADHGRTQAEYAHDRQPTLALVCLGYDQLLRAAVEQDATQLPTGHQVEQLLTRLLQTLPAATTTLVTTVPDPLDSAYFSTPETAAAILKTTPEFLHRHWGVGADDLVHLPGLWAMGYQTMARQVGPLAESPILPAALAASVRATIADANTAVRAAAERAGAHVFDLHATVERVARQGLQATRGTTGHHLDAGYLGGLYLLNGAYPGPTLNAHLAAEMVAWIGQEFSSVAVTAVPVDEIAASDVNTLTQLAPGEPATDAFLHPRTADEIPSIPPLPPSAQPLQEPPIQTTYPSLQPGKQQCTPAVGIPAGGLDDPSYDDPDFQPLEIPAGGWEATLDVNPELSCVGDALRPVDCPGEPPLLPGFPPFGLCERTFFGGFLPTTSALSGKIHVRIEPPDAEGKARFEIRHPSGLQGTDGDLSGPQLFRMPVQHTQVQDLPGLVSGGVLDTRTGSVYNFHYNLQNTNTALHCLMALNPDLPPPVRAALLTFPGQPNGGSSWARFTPRPGAGAQGDGFDVEVAAHMFVPLGAGSAEQPVRFALPFTTPDLQAASFVARGTSLHPRIYLTTRATPSTNSRVSVDDWPCDRVCELSAFGHETCFGDAFDLHAPELGGPATGRGHLLARVRVQFGARCGNTVPVVLQILPAGGLLDDAPVVPPFLPPGVSRGGGGFDTVMHFPKLSYDQSGLSSPDDPFNVCTATLHLPSGQIAGPLLWRGYVVQSLFAELIQVEPCTPADSFNYQGPGCFERGPDGTLVLRWNGDVFLPYPAGFHFPSAAPGGRPPLLIREHSRLDPFRSVRAVTPAAAPTLTHDPNDCSRGDVQRARSPATGVEFSYRWSIPHDPRRAPEAWFEYSNHTHGGTFRLSTLTWLDLSHTLEARDGSEPDVLSFSGFGTWSEDPGGIHQVSVQISRADDAPFVGIQVDGGVTSNVDLKPAQRTKA